MYKSLITEPLGLFGWSHLEPVILASLATEMPMLLVGKHGCAKSFLLERLAEALKLEFRCYNASLINYDDLVGIPIPVKNNTSLDYISNPNSIWDAEVVFIDELNRTKPELQNKLFPIIYDKRIQGQNLKKLRYRWAAMNPPCNDEDEEADINYLGAMKLDPALADRFPFIIEVPSWDELSEEDKEKMLSDQFKGRHEFIVDINKLISKTKTKLSELISQKQEETSKYIITLVGLLKDSLGYISPRRATMFLTTFLAIYAAKQVLNELNSVDKFTFEDIAYLHIQNVFPKTAERSIDKTLLINICNEALKISKLSDSPTKKLLLIPDPIDQVKYLIKNSQDIETKVVCDVIPNAISKIDNLKKRRVVSLAIYLTLRKNSEVYASIVETLANDIRPIFETKESSTQEYLKTKRIADKVDVQLATIAKNKSYYKYLNNTLKSFLPEGYDNEDEPSEVLNFFVNLWEELKL